MADGDEPGDWSFPDYSDLSGSRPPPLPPGSHQSFPDEHAAPPLPGQPGGDPPRWQDAPPPQPPFGAPMPPTDLSPQVKRGLRGCFKIGCIGLVTVTVGLAVLVGACVYFLVSETRPAVDATNEFLDRLDEGDLAGADELSCTGDARPIATQLTRVGWLGSQNLNSVSITNSEAVVSGTITTENGVVDVSFTLIESGGWKVCTSSLPIPR